MQLSFSRLWDGFATDAEAKAARDAQYRALKLIPGNRVRRFTLANQCRKYESLGNPDGRSCTVYYIDVTTAEDVERILARVARTAEGRMRDAFNGRA